MSRKPRLAAEIAQLTTDWEQQSGSDNDWKTYACKLVTPLYGGGVTAGVVDDSMPIRVSSIRGQLRFWWRVSCAPLDNPRAMFKAESAIWGGIGAKGPAASQIRIRVRNVSRVDLKPAFRYQPDKNNPGQLRSFPAVEDWAEPYALFSAQGKLTRNRRDFEEPPKELAQVGVTFDLEVAYGQDLSDAQREEVETALRWWASFGGVGARTRRGLGSVKIDGLTAVTDKEVKGRGGLLVLRNSAGDAAACWKAAVARLKAFRQGLNIGRNPPAAGSPSPAGRSLWPEADTIRALAGTADSRHAARLVNVDAFPRAAFGLPVVFHFKDERSGDPGDHVLEPADECNNDRRDRMASPLIVGPYHDGNRWRPMALLLPGWEEAISQPLKFKNNGLAPRHWPKADSERAKLAASVRPLSGRGNDPLTAFMQFFTE